MTPVGSMRLSKWHGCPNGMILLFSSARDVTQLHAMVVKLRRYDCGCYVRAGCSRVVRVWDTDTVPNFRTIGLMQCVSATLHPSHYPLSHSEGSFYLVYHLILHSSDCALSLMRDCALQRAAHARTAASALGAWPWNATASFCRLEHALVPLEVEFTPALSPQFPEGKQPQAAPRLSHKHVHERDR
jgi:hypothetical protein